MSDEERVFTVEDAEALLPAVRPLLEDLLAAHGQMDELHERVMTSSPTNGGGEAHRAFSDAASRASRALASITEMGIVVRDPASGLVDFPAEREGARVFLCWRLGEEGLGWWHPPETGFAGRQPL